MSLSSLQKTATTSKSLVLVFLVGLLSLTFLVLIVNKVFAATAAPIAPTSTSAVGIQTVTYTWTAPAAFSGTAWIVASSTNRVPTANQVVTSTPTSTVSFTFVRLATNTLYYFGAAGADAGAISAYATSSPVYTLAAPAGTPLVQTDPTVSSIFITLDPASNPTNTTYALFNTTTQTYVAANGSDNGSTPIWQTTSTWGSNFEITGLTANTTYRIEVVARNGDGVPAATSSAASSLTLANTPSSLSLSAGGNGFTFTWSGDSTEYYAEDVTAGTNSGWISGTSFSVNGVNCGTTHSFRVKGRNSDDEETSFSSSVSATTGACGTGIIVGGSVGATPATPATPAVPGVTPAVPATPATPASGNSGSVSLPASASPVAVFVHTLRVGQKSNEVKQLQAKLRELGYFTYPTDTGYFGAVTRAAVVAFQKAQGLKPFPGHVGPGTRAALNSL